MSQSHSGNYMDYMDGVPVKISEKYKPPPTITLPNGVFESASRAADLLQSIEYDFSLENNVLEKLVEWQNVRETLKNRRNHRLQLIEEARQRELDLKAATENEERLKQLSISEVSYPSTEEISEMSPDDTEEGEPVHGNVTPTSTAQGTNTSSVNYVQNVPECHSVYANCMFPGNVTDKSEMASDILQPTPVSPRRQQTATNLLDDLDPIQQFQQNIANQSQHKLSYIRPSYMKHNLDNLTFSDFENDTSSPFDNMELKTINDLELLAQVLNTEQASTIPLTYNENKINSVTQPCNGITYNQIYSNSHSINADPYSSKQIYGNPIQNDLNPVQMMPYSYVAGSTTAGNNGYYDSGGKLSVQSGSGIPNSVNYYTPPYCYPPTNTIYQQLPNINYNQSGLNVSHSEQVDQSVEMGSERYQRDNTTNLFNNSFGYYTNYPVYPTPGYSSYLPTNQDTVVHTEDLKKDDEEPKISFGFRSRSVPDIVRELDEEVAIARQRAKERSHNCSPALRPSPVASIVQVAPKQSNLEKLSDPYRELSPTLQIMCKQISSMGFPLDRVARACKDIGTDDKRVVEYLLFMGQLMDLGFTESKVGSALLKNNCNRDKALDDLIS